MDKYIGTELEAFSFATNWKSYFASQILPLLKGEVLEVGAGLGTTTEVLYCGKIKSWVCLEPDREMAELLERKIAERELPLCCKARKGTLRDLGEKEKFDSILYIDVLEHIEKDAEEAHRAFDHLLPGGRLIILSPAFQFLFTPFDEAIGHFRRYTKKTLSQALPPSAKLLKLRYMDSLGMIALFINRFFMRTGVPSPGQVKLWDLAMVPFSRIFDPLLDFSLGKSILGIWEKE